MVQEQNLTLYVLVPSLLKSQPFYVISSHKTKASTFKLPYLTFLMRMDCSLRAKSMDLIFRSRFFLARTFFSEFLMWWVCCALISLSIPLDCIFLCSIVSALSRSPENTFTLIPLSCCSWLWLDRVTSPVTRFAIVFIFPERVMIGEWMTTRSKKGLSDWGNETNQRL